MIDFAFIMALLSSIINPFIQLFFNKKYKKHIKFCKKSSLYLLFIAKFAFILSFFKFYLYLQSIYKVLIIYAKFENILFFRH